MSIEDRVVVISGGSSGIGHAFISHAREKGAHIYSLDLEEPSKPVDGVKYIKCDIRDEKQVEQVFSNIKEPINILVNNAGVIRRGTIFDSTEADYDLLFDTNVKGSWLMLKYADSKMHDDAMVIQVSSGHATHTEPDPGIYSLTKKTALELAHILILTKPSYIVKLVIPGPVDTPLVRYGRKPKDIERIKKVSHSPDFLGQKIVKLIESDHKRLVFDPKEWDYHFE